MSEYIKQLADRFIKKMENESRIDFEEQKKQTESLNIEIEYHKIRCKKERKEAIRMRDEYLKSIFK